MEDEEIHNTPGRRLAEVFISLLSRFGQPLTILGGPSFNFGSAHYNYNIGRDLPLSFNIMLEEMYEYENEHGKKQTAKRFNLPLTSKVIAEILRQETTLDAAEECILPFHKSTRDALEEVVTGIAAPWEKVALPLPNWHFWCMGGYEKTRFGFEYFDGMDEGQLVENFAKIAPKKKVRALMLVNPANPLMYNISESAAREIDRIALQHGVEIIIDDVLRGVQPVGQRDSIGRFFTKPYVVEGFSKRFGDNPLGFISYVLVPESDKFLKPKVSQEEACLCGYLVEVAYKHSTAPAIEELRKRNIAFDEGVRSKCPEVRIIRPSETHLITLLELPDRMDGCKFTGSAHNAGVELAARNSFYPDGYEKNGSMKNMVRVSVGNMDESMIRQGAEYLGTGIERVRELLRNG